MAFSSRRGRPRKAPSAADFGTPELRHKHAHGLTREPIDLCLEREVITPEQHWCGLHLRWLHTLRYGAPLLTARYTARDTGGPATDDPVWRSGREQEYTDAVLLLRSHRRCDPVMKLAVFNEMPAFLNLSACERAWKAPALADTLLQARHEIIDGLALLVVHWHRE